MRRGHNVRSISLPARLSEDTTVRICSLYHLSYPILTPDSDRRPPQPFASGQQPNFKTNVNRAKTKKWVEAKKTNYDGDDWGDYDEYDEYGVDTPPAQPEPSQQYAQPAPQGRNFTDPQ